jgi:hypothetical protein
MGVGGRRGTNYRRMLAGLHNHGMEASSFTLQPKNCVVFLSQGVYKDKTLQKRMDA